MTFPSGFFSSQTASNESIHSNTFELVLVQPQLKKKKKCDSRETTGKSYILVAKNQLHYTAT